MCITIQHVKFLFKTACHNKFLSSIPTEQICYIVYGLHFCKTQIFNNFLDKCLLLKPWVNRILDIQLCLLIVWSIGKFNLYFYNFYKKKCFLHKSLPLQFYLRMNFVNRLRHISCYKAANGQLRFEKFHEAHKNLVHVVSNISHTKTVYYRYVLICQINCHQENHFIIMISIKN